MTFRKLRRPAAAATTVTVLAGLTAGCSSSSDATAVAPPETVDVIVGIFPTIDSSGVFIAQMDGFFARYGLKVTFKYEQTSQDAVDDQISGKVDISSADYVTYLDNEVSGKAHLRIIAGASLMRQNELQLLVPAHSPIVTVAGLAGKTIGVAGPGDIATLLVDELLTENGVSPRQVVYKPGTILPDAPADLAKGDFAAAPVPEPFVSNGEESYGVEELADMDQGATENFPLQGYAATDTWAQANPGTIKDFIAALTHGQEIADAQRGQVEKAAEEFLQVPARTAALMSLPDYPLTITRPELNRVLYAMVEFGLLPKKDKSFNTGAMLG